MPRWSPDDESVLFTVGQVSEAESAVFVMDSDGSNLRQLSPWGMWGTWSPSGRHIAFSSLGRAGSWQQGDPIDLFVMNADGSNVRRLTEQPGENQDPDWSPDGRALVFDSYREWNFDIYTIELDTGWIRRLTDHPAADARPAFSPDGQHIVFHSTRDVEGQRGKDLYVMDADGSNVRRLTRRAAEGRGGGRVTQTGKRGKNFCARFSRSEVAVFSFRRRRRTHLSRGQASSNSASRCRSDWRR